MTKTANVETWTGKYDILGENINFGDYIFVNECVYQVFQSGEPTIKENGIPDYNTVIICVTKDNWALNKSLKFWQFDTKVLKLTPMQVKLYNKLNYE